MTIDEQIAKIEEEYKNHEERALDPHYRGMAGTILYRMSILEEEWEALIRKRDRKWWEIWK